jgi:tetratricopeptide (TPR) repeat protein
LNKGVKAFTESEYAKAAEYFKEAVELDPQFEVARMYLATAYTQQFVPGSPDPHSTEMANNAIKTFQEVVDANPSKPNENAMISIASLYYQLKEYDKSKEWCGRIGQLYPNNPDAPYRVAVIDYDESVAKTGLQGEGIEFMSLEEKQHTLQDIDEGLKMLDRALQLRPDYFDAMEYQNLLWREKAKFEKDEAAKSKLLQQADLIAQKALQLRLESEAEAAKKPKKLAK